MPDTPMSTIQDLATYFKISVPTARKWVKNGTIPKDTYLKAAGVYRFDICKVEKAMIDANAAANTNLNEEAT